MCRGGDVELTLVSLGYNFRASPMEPKFPLCFHEKFYIEGAYTNVENITVLGKILCNSDSNLFYNTYFEISLFILANEPIDIALWQQGRRLAYYSGKLGPLLQLHSCDASTESRVDTDLIMTRANCFPGSIAPKIQLSVRTQIVDKCLSCKVSFSRSLKRPYQSVSESHLNPSVQTFRRQKPVCHVKSNGNR